MIFQDEGDSAVFKLSQILHICRRLRFNSGCGRKQKGSCPKLQDRIDIQMDLSTEVVCTIALYEQVKDPSWLVSVRPSGCTRQIV